MQFKKSLRKQATAFGGSFWCFVIAFPGACHEEMRRPPVARRFGSLLSVCSPVCLRLSALRSGSLRSAEVDIPMFSRTQHFLLSKFRSAGRAECILNRLRSNGPRAFACRHASTRALFFEPMLTKAADPAPSTAIPPLTLDVCTR
jgi:hypothetical protein